MTIKHGIIGTGAMARAHAQHFGQIRGVKLHACCDLDAERAADFAEQYHFAKAVPSVEDLLAECDSVSIVTPDATHAELSIKALQAGRHVLCEKPLATNLADARKVGRAAQAATRKHGVAHLINFSYRDAPAFHRAAQLIAAGRLGHIRHVTGKYLQAWLTSTLWGDWENHEAWQWRLAVPRGGSQASGGTLGDIGCHILDFATGVAGDLCGLRCTLRTFPKTSITTGKTVKQRNGYAFAANDTVLLELDFKNGALGQLETTRWATGHPNQVALGVYGTEGALEIDLERDRNVVRHCLGNKRHQAEWTEQTLKPTPTNYQRFIKAIKTGQPQQPDILRGAQVQAYLDAAERSALDQGKPVKIAKWS